MQAGKHDKAFAHFSEAAKFDDAAGLFNLAICYEMGFGTKQCFNKVTIIVSSFFKVNYENCSRQLICTKELQHWGMQQPCTI